ncbi:thioredoxin family protein [Oceanihabitans sp. 2_MG-2023]|uniref:thioredoxin family protein n=1 Tax=Oceanihabitans sp. 2_MG-2023 TaxID=3062661 RepID=UPI0026E1C71D|nr:thioredoxin family protein [Oceanihabitans sp. 2_MG-2023]MDO6595521.1 thioredoxin family protein [Oceanihabitans sp. 2_MG-2023]
MQNIIKESLDKSITYPEYVTLVKELAENKDTTGTDKSENLVEYTMLNARRMKRWDKTLKVNEVVKEQIEKLDKKVTWLVLTESWCGDAAHVMPAMQKVAELNDNIKLQVVLRDENEALMNNFLTNGGKSIPKLIMVDDVSGEVVNTFGPRPSAATQLVNDYKEEHGKLTPEFKEDLQRWYNKDKGQNAVDDLLKLLQN